jgi:hypothetical protein
MSPVPGRTRPEAELLMGCLVMSLLLRVRTAGDPTFGEHLARVRATTLDALDNQFFPYEEFRRWCPETAWIRYESWGGPAHLPGLESEEFDLTRDPVDEDWEAPFQMPEGDVSTPELSIAEQPDGSMKAFVVYNRYAYEPATPEALAEMFVRCCERASEHPELRLSEIAR